MMHGKAGTHRLGYCNKTNVLYSSEIHSCMLHFRHFGMGEVTSTKQRTCAE